MVSTTMPASIHPLTRKWSKSEQHSALDWSRNGATSCRHAARRHRRSHNRHRLGRRHQKTNCLSSSSTTSRALDRLLLRRLLAAHTSRHSRISSMRKMRKKQMAGRLIADAAVSCAASKTSISMNRIDLSLHLHEHTVPNSSVPDTRDSGH